MKIPTSRHLVNLDDRNETECGQRRALVRIEDAVPDSTQVRFFCPACLWMRMGRVNAPVKDPAKGDAP